MTMEVKIAVMMKDGVVSRYICCCALTGNGLNAVDIKAGTESPEGRIHRVHKNVASSVKCTIISATANSRDRNLSSPTNLQLTVHLYINTRESSNDLVK